MDAKHQPEATPEDPKDLVQKLKEGEKIAYESVPTHEEMLSGRQPLSPEQQEIKPYANRKVVDALDEQLAEAAREGNIGGG